MPATSAPSPPDGAPSNPAGPAPLRRPHSVRRTSTIETTWPEGYGKPMRMIGRARDVFTSAAGGAPEVLREDRIAALLTPMREIVEIESFPSRPSIAALVGCRAGGHLRAEITRVFPAERAEAAPLYLLLDDLSGASLVAGWAWSRWTPDWMEQAKKAGMTSTAGRGGVMEGICAGFRPGSSALAPDRGPGQQNATPVDSLVNPEDPDGWHPFTEQAGEPASRRARRLDLWRDDVIHIGGGFQDSSTAPAGGRIAIHEYLIEATADPHTLGLLSVSVDPRILPFRECPAAAPNATRMIGKSLPSMRESVLGELRGTAGCTHLNDVLRSFAEAPQILKAGLDGAQSRT